MATYGTFVDGVTLKASEINDFFVRKTFTPVVAQSGTVTASSVTGRYYIVNKLVFCLIRWVCSGNGTAGSQIDMTLPVTATSNTNGVIGSGWFRDASSGINYPFCAVQISTTKMAFLTSSADSVSTYLGETNGPAITLANADYIYAMLMYEVA